VIYSQLAKTVFVFAMRLLNPLFYDAVK